MGKCSFRAVIAVIAVGLLAGCGAKQELIPGAEKMTDDQKKEQVQKYVSQWSQNLNAALKSKNLEMLPCTYSGVLADGQCDLDLSELNGLFEAGLGEAGIGIMEMAPGLSKVKMLYKLPANKDPAKAECKVTIAIGVPTGFTYVAEYRPDPRVFAVYLPQK